MRGRTRVVFKMGQYVIKFAFANNLIGFYRGLYANCRERLLSIFIPTGDIAKTYFNFFGLFSIQEYCRPISKEEYDSIDKNKLKPRIRDAAQRNFGFSVKKNKIVAVDYER